MEARPNSKAGPARIGVGLVPYPNNQEVIDAILRMRSAPEIIQKILDEFSGPKTTGSTSVLADYVQHSPAVAPVLKWPAIKRETWMDKELFQAMQAGMRKRLRKNPPTVTKKTGVKMTSALVPTDEYTGELTVKGKDLHKRIRQILEPQFVSYDRVAYTMALALSCNQNAWFYGHGGYGKSTMIETVMRGLGLGPELYVQSFGQGMTPEKLVGNLDLAALNNENVMRFNVAESFMAKKYAIFEEMPDAAINVLFMLKDTLERRIFRDGAQQFPIRTQCIIVLSNRSPKAVAEYGVDAEALTQRFPFRESVEWQDHSPAQYEALFIKREPTLEGPLFGQDTRQALAQILGDAAARGEPIPPRIALHAARAVKGAAELRGGNTCTPEDFSALRHVAGLEALGGNIEKEVKAAAERAAAEDRVRTAESKSGLLFSEFDNANSPIKSLQVVKKLKKHMAEVITPLKVTDALAERKEQLVIKCNELIGKARERAEELTV